MLKTQKLVLLILYSCFSFSRCALTPWEIIDIKNSSDFISDYRDFISDESFHYDGTCRDLNKWIEGKNTENRIEAFLKRSSCFRNNIIPIWRDFISEDQKVSVF